MFRIVRCRQLQAGTLLPNFIDHNKLSVSYTAAQRVISHRHYVTAVQQPNR